jgi:hypothetical protein
LLTHLLRQIPEQFSSKVEWFSSFDKFVAEELRCGLQRAVACEAEEGCDHIGLAGAKGAKRDGDSGMVTDTLTFAVETAVDLQRLKRVACTFCLLVRKCPPQLAPGALSALPHFLVHIGYPPKKTKRGEISTTYQASYMQSAASSRFAEDCAGGEGKMRAWTAVVLGVGSPDATRLCDALWREDAPPFMADILSGHAVHCAHLPPTALPLTHYATGVSDGDEDNDNDCNDDGDDDGDDDSSDDDDGADGDGDDMALVSPFIASLNESQKEAILSVLRVGRADIPSIQIIKGPPGI